MQILKPEIEELKKKYPNDKQMVGAKQMELFRSAGVNPMGGCLPMLLQMPILFAMYRFFPNSIELRQEPFLWATDLSHYDSIMHLPFTIPLYGDHVSLFTLLMAITSFGYTRMTMSQQQMSVGNDDMMATQMKIMQYVTPFMFLFMFNSFSAALSYYYFLFNLLSIIQTYVLKKFFINEDALRAEIEFNKKQPKKKSSWQNRMDQMMDQQKAVQEKRKGK
jgi:YidC/Oxa1 family membrane protein insertase